MQQEPPGSSGQGVERLLRPGVRCYLQHGDTWQHREIRAVVDEEIVVWRWWRGRHYGWAYETVTRYFLQMCWEGGELRRRKPST